MTEPQEKKYFSRGRLVFYGFFAMAGFLLFTEHRTHLMGILPYLFLLACPSMHMFMYHGHHNHDSHGHHHGSSEGGSK